MLGKLGEGLKNVFNNNTGFFQGGKSFGGMGIAGLLGKLGQKKRNGLGGGEQPDNSQFNANPEGAQGYMEMQRLGQIPGAMNPTMQPGEYDDEGMPIMKSPYKGLGRFGG